VIVPSLTKRSELAYLPLFEEQQSLYCSTRHTLARRRRNDVPASALAEHAFVARGYLHSEDLRRIGHRGAEATVETMEAQLILILSAEFIGYLPAHYASDWVDRGDLHCLNEHAFSYGSPFFAVRMKAAIDNVLVQDFLSLRFEAMAAGNAARA
jgi:DNA-binding transcriptional LysR family regulator